eukprot:scaffold9537_cov111-Skeletonema_dohrnii-CCMP3373.AAC.6
MHKSIDESLKRSKALVAPEVLVGENHYKVSVYMFGKRLVIRTEAEFVSPYQAIFSRVDEPSILLTNVLDLHDFFESHFGD